MVSYFSLLEDGRKTVGPVSCILYALVRRAYLRTRAFLAKIRERISWYCGLALILKMEASPKNFLQKL